MKAGRVALARRKVIKLPKDRSLVLLIDGKRIKIELSRKKGYDYARVEASDDVRIDTGDVVD